MFKVAIMLCSPQKYLFSIEIEISAIVISTYGRPRNGLIFCDRLGLLGLCIK